MNKKYFLIVFLLIFLINIINCSAYLCKGSDGYYNDCSIVYRNQPVINYYSYNKGYYNGYSDGYYDGYYKKQNKLYYKYIYTNPKNNYEYSNYNHYSYNYNYQYKRNTYIEYRERNNNKRYYYN